jgi:DNA-binding LacI/PurR family transcriptional regulator
MTLTELARLAHVSTSTASKAFAQSSEINQETKEMIFEVAKQNGCFK